MGIHSNERQDKIFSMLESRGRMSVSDLAEYFQVTETTIRRDLITMEENHQIVRRRGFAELPLQAASGLRRRNTFQEEKQRIARKAMELISYGTTLALDSGTSVAELVQGSSTTPSTSFSSSARCKMSTSSIWVMGRAAVACSASAVFTEVKMGR